MSDPGPILLIVKGERDARTMQRLFDPKEIVVMACSADLTGYRFRAIINTARESDFTTPAEIRAYQEWRKYLPTRLAAGNINDFFQT